MQKGCNADYRINKVCYLSWCSDQLPFISKKVSKERKQFCPTLNIFNRMCQLYYLHNRYKLSVIPVYLVYLCLVNSLIFRCIINFLHTINKLCVSQAPPRTWSISRGLSHFSGICIKLTLRSGPCQVPLHHGGCRTSCASWDETRRSHNLQDGTDPPGHKRMINTPINQFFFVLVYLLSKWGDSLNSNKHC